MQSKKAIRKTMRFMVGIGATLCLMMTGLLLPALPANAATTVEVSASAPATVESGDYFTANVNILDVTGFDAADFRVVVDPAVLEIETPGSDVTDGQIGAANIPVTSCVPEAPGTYKIVVNVLGSPGVDGSGYLCQIKFHVLGAAGTSSAINFQNGLLGNVDLPPVEIPSNWTGTTVDVDDATAPTVITKSPTGNNVPIDTEVTATFSEDMSPGTITTGSFTVTGSAVAGSVSYNNSNKKATFIPDSMLDYDHRYTVNLSTAITDGGGNPLGSSYSWSFKTERPPSCNDGSVNVAFVPGPGRSSGGTLPATSNAAFSAFTFTNVPFDSVDAEELADYDTVVLISCDPMSELDGSQRTDIVDWVENGGKLIIYDSECQGGGNTLEVTWLPCPYTVHYPGAVGGNSIADPWVDLEIVENNTLSSGDSESPYYINADKVASQTDAAGDQNVFIAQSDCWCGDMVGTNVLDEDGERMSPGTTGYSHAYSRHENGLIIYNGLDIDVLGSASDPTDDTGEGFLAKIWLLELQQTWDQFSGRSACGLPCGIGLGPEEDEVSPDTVVCDVPSVTDGPPQMSIQNVLTIPENGVQNQMFEVWVSVGNSGDTEGTKTVALYVNGAWVDSQTVSVGPGGGENVLFWVSRAVPGTYTASIEGREAQFTVLGTGPPQSAPAPPTAAAGLGGGLGTGGIIAIIVIVLAIGIGLVVILRREST